MPLVVPKDEGGNYERCPEGNHVAVCCGVIDLGTHWEEFEGKDGKNRRKIRIIWEISGEAQSDGQPFKMSKTYNLSMNEKATFRKDLESWRGQKFTPEELGRWEIKRLIAVGCMLNVIHAEGQNGKTYANVAGIARLPKGMATPPTTDPPLFFSLEPDEFDYSTFDLLTNKTKEEVKNSPEWKELAASVDQNGKPALNQDDEIPF